jgi:drug/metabolite transporter (DMT)-like permease
MLPYLWMLLGSLAFALMSTLAHALADSCDWQVIALTRAVLAFCFVALLARAAGVRVFVWRPRTLWMRSLAGSVSLVCTFYALTRLPVSDVLTLTNMFPIWVGLLSWPLLRERPTARVWMAAVSGVAGVALIQRPHFAEGNFASLLALMSSFFTAVAMIGLHRLHQVDFRSVVVHFSGVSSVFCLVALVCLDHPVAQTVGLTGETLVMLLGVGATATVGQLSLTKAFALGAPAKVSVVALTQVVFAMLFEIVILERSFHAVTLLGMSLVLAPTAWLMACQA